MGGGVGGVIELAGDEAAGNGRGQLLRLCHGTGHAAGLHQHQLRAVGLQHGPALGAHGSGHGEDHPVAPRHSHGCQTDAGVAGGRLDHGAAGLQSAGGLRLIQHFQRDTILGAAGGVEALQLRQNGGGQLTLTDIVIYAQQRGIAHKLRHRMINSHDIVPFFFL